MWVVIGERVQRYTDTTPFDMGVSGWVYVSSSEFSFLFLCVEGVGMLGHRG